MPDGERGSSGSMSGSGEPASTAAPGSAGRMRPRREFRSVYFSRPFRDHLARKAEQTPDPTIAEPLRLLRQALGRRGRACPRGGRWFQQAGGMKTTTLPAVSSSVTSSPSRASRVISFKVTPAHPMELRVRRWAVVERVNDCGRVRDADQRCGPRGRWASGVRGEGKPHRPRERGRNVVRLRRHLHAPWLLAGRGRARGDDRHLSLSRRPVRRHHGRSPGRTAPGASRTYEVRLQADVLQLEI